MDKESIKELNKWQPVKVLIMVIALFGALWFALEIIEKLGIIIELLK